MFKYLWIVILVIVEGITGYKAVIDIIDSIKDHMDLDDNTQAWLLINGILLFIVSLAVFCSTGEKP